MKKRLFSILLCLAVVFSIIGVIVPTETEAASVKLNKKKVTIYEGDTYELKLKKANGDIVWKTSKKSVATVKDGIVTAKKAGKATISAVYNDKTYKCKVTVKKRETVENESSSDPVANETVETLTPEPTKVPTPTPEPTKTPNKTSVIPGFPGVKPDDSGTFVFANQIAESFDGQHHAWIALSDISLAKVGFKCSSNNSTRLEEAGNTQKGIWTYTGSRGQTVSDEVSNEQALLINLYGYLKRTENNKLDSKEIEEYLAKKTGNPIVSETVTLNKSNRDAYAVVYSFDDSYYTSVFNELELMVHALVPVGNTYYCSISVTIPYAMNGDYKDAYNQAIELIDELISLAVIIED